MKPVLILSCLSLAAMLTACASAPPSQYYTLSVPAASSQAAGASPTSPGFAISVPAVKVPEQVDRPQIVLNQVGGTQVALLNESQWAAPLADEIRTALSNELSRRLGVLDVNVQAAPDTLPLWLITVTVQRFESIYGGQAVLEATWRQVPRNGAKGKSAICRAQIEVPVEAGMPALVAGHQQAVRTLAGLMADKLSGQQMDAAPGVTLKGCV